jgi:hypothetical protein
MELLKVFVGDGANTGTTVATMVKGDLLLLNASNYAPWSSGDAVIAACNDNGVYFSTPIKAANVKWTGYKAPVSAVEKVVTAAVGSGDLVAGGTYTLGVQIKEDLRMGTYNKNTEILSSYVLPASITSTTDIALKADMASSLAKGFAANPLTSAGSPYQQVRVTRNASSALASAVTVGTSVVFTMAAGQRQVTYTGGTLATAIVPGTILNLNDSWYLVEKVDSTNGIVTLDTAYQGTATSASAGTTATSAYYVLAANYPDGFTFKFQGVSQTQKNRYDQFRMVEFVVITPKGNDTGLVTITETASTQPVGSYRQVRDLEEKAYTNSNPLINYREFPFQTFALNADSTKTYGIFTAVYEAGWGYNMMQKSNSVFPQTVVVCAPEQADGQFDATGSGTTFAEAWAAFAGSATLLDGSTFTNS